MGLLDSLLEVPEHLRVWQMAGVRHFYLDPQATAAAGDAPSDVAAPADTPSDVAPVAPTGGCAQAAPGERTTAGPDPAPAPSFARPTAAEPLPAPAASDSPRSALPPHPDAWPAPWPALFAKAPAKPRLVIAYRELGYDLTGQADPRRGGLWRNLIRDLGLSGQNAVAFWPMALPRDGQLADHPEIFAAGLALFSPSVTAVFGSLPESFAAALASRADAAALVIHELPHPDVLLQGDPEVWDHVRALLAVG